LSPNGNKNSILLVRLLTGADSIEELQKKVHEVNKILAEEGLSLAK